MSLPLVRFVKTLVYAGLESFGRYYSSYRAFVFDNKDPEGLQRIQLIIPQITGTQAYKYWAYPKNVYFGPNYGSQCIPEKGDMVWVEFECGSPEVPIWSHGHPGKDEYPKDPDLKAVDCYWFKTPRGNLIKVYDTKNLIHIENTLGDMVEINEQGVSVECKGDRRVSIKNNQTSLRDILNKMNTNYISTKTIDGKGLSPTSMKKGINSIEEVNKLLF